METGIFNNFYHYLIAEFEKGGEQLHEPDYICAARRKAFEVFKEKGFPSTRVEDWKYTNLNRVLKTEFKLPQKDDTEVKGGLDDVESIESDSYKLFLLNGVPQWDLSDELPPGIRFYDHDEALSHPVFVSNFATIANDESNAMLALNTAFFDQVCFLHVTAGSVIEKPVFITHLFSTKAPQFIPCRMLIVAEKRSEVTVVETFQSMEGPALVSYVCEQMLEESAILNADIINNFSSDIIFIHHRETHQYANSVLNSLNVSFPGAPFIRNDINSRLKGSYTETNLWGIYLSADHQLVDNHTLVDHQNPFCNSNEWYKGILMDKSHGVFNGKVKVEKDAQKTNAFQQNNNLLMSDHATINSKPQLEIFADDVKCSHGSTVGKMDKEALFYIISRGISKETANKLLIEAFAYDVLSKIKVAGVVDYIRKLIHQHLAAGELVANQAEVPSIEK